MSASKTVSPANYGKTDFAKLDGHVVQPAEYTEIPELTDEWFDRAHHHIGEEPIRRGRPKLERPKQPLSLRLDQDLIERFRATGPGWQSKINAALREHVDRQQWGNDELMYLGGP